MAYGEDAAERYEMQEPVEFIRDDGSVIGVVDVLKSQLPAQLRGFVDLALREIDPSNFPAYDAFQERFATFPAVLRPKTLGGRTPAAWARHEQRRQEFRQAEKGAEGNV